MIRSRRSCGLLTPWKLNLSDASSLAVSKSIEPTFMIRSTGDCLTVMFWIRSTLVELSVFERMPRRMLSRFVVIVYCVKNRSTHPARIVSAIPPIEDGADQRRRQVDADRVEEDEKAEDDERDRDPLDVEREHRAPGRVALPDHRLVPHHLHGGDDTKRPGAGHRPAEARRRSIAWRMTP